MDATKEDNFDTLVFDTFNQTYDWKSISHYTNKEFRKKNTLGYTLVSKVSHFVEATLKTLEIANISLLCKLVYRNLNFSKLPK